MLMTPDLETTNMWLAILAVAAAVQTTLLVGAALGMFMVYRKTTRTLEVLEQRHVAPIAARAQLIMDEVQDVTARARRVDEAVRSKLHGVEGAVREVRDAVGDRMWPVLGVARALRVGLRVFTAKSPADITVPGRAERATTL
jgi:hypothetical protein